MAATFVAKSIVLLLLANAGVDAFGTQCSISRHRICASALFSTFDDENQVSRRKILQSSFAVASSGLILPQCTLADDSRQSIHKDSVPTIQLGGGKSSLRISRTIQGYWQLAGGHGSYREVDALENMQAHYDAGITTLDTADIYGPSELIVGKFVKSQPGAVPCTKFCCFRYLEVSFSCPKLAN